MKKLLFVLLLAPLSSLADPFAIGLGIAMIGNTITAKRPPPRYAEPPDPKTIDVDRDVMILKNGSVVIMHPPKCMKMLTDKQEVILVCDR